MRKRLVFKIKAENDTVHIRFNYNYHLYKLLNEYFFSNIDLYKIASNYGLFKKTLLEYISFSQLIIPDRHICRDCIEVQNTGEIIVLITSPIEELLLPFVPDKKIPVEFCKEQKNAYLHLERVETIEEPVFTEEQKFTCLSPIALINRQKNYKHKHLIYYETDPEYFKTMLFNNLINKYTRLYKKTEEMKNFLCKIELDEYYYNQRRGKISKLYRCHTKEFGDLAIKAYLTPFTMKCCSDLMSFAYNTGLGDYTYLGFGMIAPASVPDDEKKEESEDNSDEK